MDSVIASLFELVLAAIGRFAVWMFTLGSWRCESWDGEEGRVHGAAGALWFTRDGRHVVTLTGQLLAGLAFCVGLIGLGIAVVLQR